MSRRVRCVAMILAWSVLRVASSQAAPTTKALPRESALVLGSVAEAWDWLVSFLRKAPTEESKPESNTANDGYLIDPNGGPH
jgi:hypothetical protein